MRVLSTALSGALLLAASAASATFSISYESEAPGLQATTATFSVGGVETFDNDPLGNSTAFISNFGTGTAIAGNYSSVDILTTDQYGGAGGTGQYAVTFSATGYSLDLTSNVRGGLNYFGYWLSALDRGNQVRFYTGNRLLFTFDPQDVINAVNINADPGAYYGNPNPQFAGQNTGEPYIFLNFFNDGGSFDKVVFAETPAGGGYESDNHTVGRFLTRGTGTSVLITSGQTPGVPEPGTWAMLIAGFGLTGLVARRRRLTGVVAA